MTIIYAHRGYSAAYPENTMLAFQQALKHGAEGIELDVHFTKDREVVIIHDLTVDRTTDGKGAVRDLTWKEIQQLNAGVLFNRQNVEKIPTLKQFLDWLARTELLCIIEIKNNVVRYEGLEEEIVRLLYAYGLEKRTILSSFNHYSLVHLHQIAPQIETAPLYRDGLYLPWSYAKTIHAQGIHPNRHLATDEIVKKSLAHGIAVRPYTINNKKDIVRLLHLNCTAIITDDVAQVVEWKKKHQQR